MNNTGNFIKTPDGSITNSNGDIIFFSIDRFKSDICEGNCCFICGRSPSETDFNDEHIIPRWVLRELDLFSKKIVLPNGDSYQYDRYKVPCCVRCNSLLSERIEQPVSDLFKGGMRNLTEHLKVNGPWLLFTWLALLYIKTHLRDKAFRWSPDKREGNYQISDAYMWEEFHHIHCIARAFYTAAELNPSMMGTFFLFPASINNLIEQFDYCDLYRPRTLCFRFRDIGVVSVLNDSCACYSLEKDRFFSKIKGPLYPLQIRELMSRLGYLNLLLKNRPRFYSEFDGSSYRISATHPESIEVDKWESTAYGEILYKACVPLLDLCKNPDIEEIKDKVSKGIYTFLFNEDGDFIKEQMIYKPAD